MSLKHATIDQLPRLYCAYYCEVRIDMMHVTAVHVQT